MLGHIRLMTGAHAVLSIIDYWANAHPSTSGIERCKQTLFQESFRDALGAVGRSGGNSSRLSGHRLTKMSLFARESSFALTTYHDYCWLLPREHP